MNISSRLISINCLCLEIFWSNYPFEQCFILSYFVSNNLVWYIYKYTMYEKCGCVNYNLIIHVKYGMESYRQLCGYFSKIANSIRLAYGSYDLLLLLKPLFLNHNLCDYLGDYCASMNLSTLSLSKIEPPTSNNSPLLALFTVMIFLHWKLVNKSLDVTWDGIGALLPDLIELISIRRGTYTRKETYLPLLN